MPPRRPCLRNRKAPARTRPGRCFVCARPSQQPSVSGSRWMKTRGHVTRKPRIVVAVELADKMARTVRTACRPVASPSHSKRPDTRPIEKRCAEESQENPLAILWGIHTWSASPVRILDLSTKEKQRACQSISCLESAPAAFRGRIGRPLWDPRNGQAPSARGFRSDAPPSDGRR
jgi:hypothetical protein